MATAPFTHIRGHMRILDGTPSTPQYIELPWVQTGATFPVNRPRPQPVIHLNRGVFDTYTSWTRGTEEGLATPVAVSLTAMLDEQTAATVLAALSDPYYAVPWLVGTSTFITASGTGSSIISGTGASFAPPQFGDDPTHRRVHVEWLWDGKTALTLDRGFRHEECYFPPDLQQVTDGDTIQIAMTYWCYGKMTQITAFTTGTNRLAAIS